ARVESIEEMMYNMNKSKWKVMLMLFKKNKEEPKVENDFSQGNHFVLQSLQELCKESKVIDESLVMEALGICIYVDIMAMKDNVVTVAFQLHHEALAEPILESVVASGNTSEEALVEATRSFYEHILKLYIKSLEEPVSTVQVESAAQVDHYYHVYRSDVFGLGRRIGSLEGDFWDMLKSEIMPYLKDQKTYWIKVFASKNKNNVICEVRFNGIEMNELSETLLTYASEWECASAYYTEKQYLLLIQEDRSYLNQRVSKEKIVGYCKKTMKLFEKCKSKEDYVNVRKQIYKITKDNTLTSELYGIIPEIYCKHMYPKVEFGHKLFILEKGKKTKEYEQKELYSFEYIEDSVLLHLRLDKVDQDIVKQVTQFSSNARAIRKALAQGNSVEELMIPGIGYYVQEGYEVR
ncbi:MAG: DUF6348 family protein, partial [Longicatena sp.]